MGSARRGSNPLAVAFILILVREQGAGCSMNTNNAESSEHPKQEPTIFNLHRHFRKKGECRKWTHWGLNPGSRMLSGCDTTTPCALDAVLFLSIMYLNVRTSLVQEAKFMQHHIFPGRQPGNWKPLPWQRLSGAHGKAPNALGAGA